MSAFHKALCCDYLRTVHLTLLSPCTPLSLPTMQQAAMSSRHAPKLRALVATHGSGAAPWLIIFFTVLLRYKNTPSVFLSTQPPLYLC